MKHNKQSPMQENYEHILMSTKDKTHVAGGGSLQTKKMNDMEEHWARSFERHMWSLSRGRFDYAVKAYIEMKSYQTITVVQISNAYLKQMSETIADCRKSNPVLMEAAQKSVKRTGRNKGIRKPKSNMYDAYDHIQHAGTTLDEDGGETERGIATNPEENLVEAINESQVKKCSLERLVEDYKLSKIAKADLLARTQKMTYEAMTYTFHGTQYMNLNYILKGVNGQLYVQDQHDRIQALDLYLKRQTSDSFATHAEVWYPEQPGTTWIFQPGPKSNIEGKAVQYEVR